MDAVILDIFTSTNLHPKLRNVVCKGYQKEGHWLRQAVLVVPCVELVVGLDSGYPRIWSLEHFEEFVV